MRIPESYRAPCLRPRLPDDLGLIALAGRTSDERDADFWPKRDAEHEKALSTCEADKFAVISIVDAANAETATLRAVPTKRKRFGVF